MKLLMRVSSKVVENSQSLNAYAKSCPILWITVKCILRQYVPHDTFNACFLKNGGKFTEPECSYEIMTNLLDYSNNNK